VFELALGLGLVLVAWAFVMEYMDSTLGMGYGTVLAPIFLLMGFSVIQIVPAILVSELCTGLIGGFFHHKVGNIDKEDLRLATILGICGIIGTIAAVFIATSIPKFFVKLYISGMVLSMGILVLTTLNKTFKYSFKKIIGIGLLASFNKGISAGGYGPVMTAGQLLVGGKAKQAIGITTWAEGLTCLIGVICYMLMTNFNVDWTLAPYLTIGALCATPLAALSVKKINDKFLRFTIGIGTFILGSYTLYILLCK